MKSIVKNLSIFALSLVMLVASISTVYAETASTTEQDLKTIGILIGSNDVNSESTITRNELIILTIRMLGKEEEALKNNYQTPFTDVDSWAAKYIGYAYANKITLGTSETKFSGKALVDRKQALTIMLRSLGYSSETDFKWDKADDYANELQLYSKNTNKSFKRGELNSMVKKTLEFKLKDDEIKLLEKLVKMGVIKQSDINTTCFNVTKGNVSYISLNYDKAVYRKGEKIDLKDLKVNVNYSDGTSKEAVEYTTNIDKVDLTTEGIKEITVTYTNGTNGTFHTTLSICITNDELYQENGLVYAVVEDTTSAKVIDCISTATEITIPSTIEYKGKKYNVDFIKDNAFARSKSANGYTSYQNLNYYYYNTSKVAYRPSGLLKVHGGKNIKYVGENAFEGCANLSEIEFIDNVECINAEAFANTGIKNLKLNKVENLRSSAFAGCTNLETVELPSNVEEFGSNVFNGCSSLKEITLPKSIVSLENSLQGCSSLKTVKLPSSLTVIGANEFSGCSSLGSLIIPNTVTSIGKDAFYNCSSLTSLDIPDSVTTIGEGAFVNCSSLSNIELSNNLEKINKNLFGGCDSLTKIVIPASVKNIYNFGGTNWKSIEFEEGCDAEIDGLTIKSDKLTEIKFPSGIRFRDYSNEYSNRYTNRDTTQYVLEDCPNLKTVTVEGGVTSYFINNCKSLTKVNLNGDFSYIPRNFIINCDSLKSITIPKSIRSIESCAFEENDNLSQVTMSDSLESYKNDSCFGENGHIINFISLEKVEEQEAKKKAEEEAKKKAEEEAKKKAEEEQRKQEEQARLDELENEKQNQEQDIENEDNEEPTTTKVVENDPEKEKMYQLIVEASKVNKNAYENISSGIDYLDGAYTNVKNASSRAIYGLSGWQKDCERYLNLAYEGYCMALVKFDNAHIVLYPNGDFSTEWSYENALDGLNTIYSKTINMKNIVSRSASTSNDYNNILSDISKQQGGINTYFQWIQSYIR